MLLAIALQESGLAWRKQHPRGPARGLWQFERTGGVAGVLRHRASRHIVHAFVEEMLYDPDEDALYKGITHNDVLAAGLARCLLWTLPRALPRLDDESESWAQYSAAWRPGKPHYETWPENHARARALIQERAP